MLIQSDGMSGNAGSLDYKMINNQISFFSLICLKQEATLAVHPSTVPRNVSILMIEGCRNVVFHDGGLKNLARLVALTVIDVGEVVFQFGSFNQALVSQIVLCNSIFKNI